MDEVIFTIPKNSYTEIQAQRGTSFDMACQIDIPILMAHFWFLHGFVIFVTTNDIQDAPVIGARISWHKDGDDFALFPLGMDRRC